MVSERGCSGAHLVAPLAGHSAALVDRNLLTLLRAVMNLSEDKMYK